MGMSREQLSISSISLCRDQPTGLSSLFTEIRILMQKQYITFSTLLFHKRMPTKPQFSTLRSGVIFPYMHVIM